MHLLSARPGGFAEDEGIVTRLEQSPADMVVLSSADTTLALLADAYAQLAAQDAQFPSLRLANLLYLRQNASLDLYLDEVLQHARLIVVDHLGSESTWPYGIGQISALARQRGLALAMFSGDLQQDPALLARSTLPATTCQQLWQYLRFGGAANAAGFLRAAAHAGLGHGQAAPPPRPLPQLAIHLPAELGPAHAVAGIDDWQRHWRSGAPVVALLFYRAHLLAGNTRPFDALALALLEQGLNPLALALDSLKDPLCLQALRSLCQQHQVQLVLNTTAFAALNPGQAGAAQPAGEADAFTPLAGDAPVLQVLISGSNREDWQGDGQGLRPRDIAMQIVLPELDGRIIGRPISFKGLLRRCALTQTDVVGYQPEPERIAFTAELAARWCRLRQLPAAEKNIALVLANYPGSEGRIGSGIGLDTPASVLAILEALRAQGHALGASEQLPRDGAQLMQLLLQGIANDPAQWPQRPALQSYALADYRQRLARLPAGMAAAIDARWGPPEADPMLRQGRFMIAGLRLGRVFIGIQPARAHLPAQPGAATQDWAGYHDAELVPPHHYLAFYFWLRDVFAIDAVVHVGTHGNLEWLPGKSLALGAHCWPDAILGPLPHLYPFIVNNPGEGAQAKRRSQAVLIGHLTPPLTQAGSHGPMQALEQLIDEYYDALLVDARRAKALRQQILQAVRQQQLAEELDLGQALAAGQDDAVLERIDAYLCELKETQIRDGLHTFGHSPQGAQRSELLLALLRQGTPEQPSLPQALAADLQLHPQSAKAPPLPPEPAHWPSTATWHGPRPALLQAQSAAPWRHHGDTRERLHLLAQQVLQLALGDAPTGCDAAGHASDDARHHASHDAQHWQALRQALPHWPQTQAVLARLRTQLAPALDACGPRELQSLCDGLQGRFVPPGPSGAPSRGRPDVLPSGRNFYTLDTRAIPTRTAWALGQQAAQRLIERYLQEHGDYPQALGLSVTWGTATMRSGGDDIAQAFALIGVRPRWAEGSQRVVDFEVVPQVGLGRPRVDVTLRISGFFRDAFANVVQMFDAAVQAVAALDGEDEAQNPIRARILRESAALQAQGLGAQQARAQAGWRVFGSAAGRYGSGLGELLHSGQWQDQAQLAQAYLQASAYAYGQHADGLPAHDALRRRLAQLNIVLHNQDQHESDLLSASDYAEFQGGMASAARLLSGRQPALYHGDLGQPQQARVRSLKEEIGRVVRARATNPKWIAGAMRHGYKGAFDIAATVDYLFGFAATTDAVSDHHWALLTDAYAGDATVRQFLAEHNSAALRDLLERLLEAMQRGLWRQPGPYQELVQQHLLELEDQLEH
ncbi:cobaltochelatase subunit CobN [Vandammella animalimorsus]|uniref:cobaltochelatase subunit CobN n=1 Tax=Vandammella animalimorsus TaxID=2029117 RepID=UPI0031BA5ECD